MLYIGFIIQLFISGIADTLFIGKDIKDPALGKIKYTKPVNRAFTEGLLFIEPGWQLEKEDNGVQVYVKPASADSYRQVKAVTHISTSVSGMVALIKDASASPRWMDRVVRYEILHSTSNTEWYTYAEIGIPWPFKNADVITHNVLAQTPDGKVVISIKNAPDYIAKYKDKSRVMRAGGSWVVTPEKNGVMVEYIFHAKPEGLSLPAWLVNAITVDSFHKSIKRMRNLAETDKYKTAKLAYIQ